MIWIETIAWKYLTMVLLKTNPVTFVGLLILLPAENECSLKISPVEGVKLILLINNGPFILAWLFILTGPSIFTCPFIPICPPIKTSFWIPPPPLQQTNLIYLT